MISIIVPIYNVATYLSACIESILQQTVEDLQIILVDDGSTDKSGSICDEYATKDVRVEVIHKKNEGLSAARNAGLQKAKGEYITFVDGDDYIHPQALEVLLTSLHSTTHSFTMILPEYVSEKRTDFSEINLTQFAVRVLSKDNLLKSLFLERGQQRIPYQAVWNKLYRKELLDGLMFKDVVSEDTEFNVQVCCRSTSALLIAAPLYYYVQRPSSIVHTRWNAKNLGELDMIINCYETLPKNDTLTRAYCLERIYRTVLACRHNARNVSRDCLYLAERKIKEAKKKTLRDFVHNPHIPLNRKAAELLFLFVPPLYELFIYGSEKLVSLRK